MGLQLNKVFDPRDNLEKARRKELENFARANGVEEVKPGMPAPLMRKILRQRNLLDIKIPQTRFLGGPPDMQVKAQPVIPSAEPARTLDAVELLESEWKDYDSMSINELRAECKGRGIKLGRRDNMESMRRKLRGQDPA